MEEIFAASIARVKEFKETSKKNIMTKAECLDKPHEQTIPGAVLQPFIVKKHRKIQHLTPNKQMLKTRCYFYVFNLLMREYLILRKTRIAGVSTI